MARWYVRTAERFAIGLPVRDRVLLISQDETQARGYDPLYVAGLTYSATRLGLAEIMVADRLARAAVMLYAIAPKLLTAQMLKRTKKERVKLQASQQ
jgi:hypothetical protein